MISTLWGEQSQLEGLQAAVNRLVSACGALQRSHTRAEGQRVQYETYSNKLTMVRLLQL